MGIIRMDADLYDQLVNYAKEHLPEEACGLIAGTEDESGRHLRKIYYLNNIDHAEDHFTLDPKDQMAAIKDMSLGPKAFGQLALSSIFSIPSK